MANQRKPGDTQTIRLAFDRIEGGKGKTSCAVLLTDEGTSINLPRDLLPTGATPGDVLAVTFRRDLEATRLLADRTKSVQDDLKSTDPGGDIQL